MGYQDILERILQAVDERAYFAPASDVEPSQREALAPLEALVRSVHFTPEAARALARQLHDSGHIDRVTLLSALHVIAAHPKVRDYAEAARMCAEQELAALELGGAHLQDNLASVERHRGVLAYLQGHHEVALDYFSRALERQRSPENLANVLCTLLRLGDEAEARALLDQIRRSFPQPTVVVLDGMIAENPDLALLRTQEWTQ